jgi:hypothetical protein
MPAGYTHDSNDLLSRHVNLLLERAVEMHCRLGFYMGRFQSLKPKLCAGPQSSITVTTEKFRIHPLAIYFTARKRFSISAQFTTFHHAPTYSFRRF